MRTLTLLATLAQAATRSSQRPRRILLSSIRTLTLYANERTTARRTRALPQLDCHGALCRRFRPDVVQCSSVGDGQWKCEADLPEALRFGKVQVSCEGWDHPDDPYILSGSCQLQYRLVENTSFRQAYQQKWQSPGINWSALIFWAIFLGVLYTIVSGWLASMRSTRPPGAPGSTRGSGGGGGWWPGGGGGWGGPGWGGAPPTDAPPPPYSKNEPGTSASSSAPSATNTGWTPGFWTGLAAGVIGDRLVNGGDHRRRYVDQQPGGGGLFMRNRFGGGRGFLRDEDEDEYDSFYRSGRAGGFRGGPSSSSSSMGGMRRATGYGGTSNR